MQRSEENRALPFTDNDVKLGAMSPEIGRVVLELRKEIVKILPEHDYNLLQNTGLQCLHLSQDSTRA